MESKLSNFYNRVRRTFRRRTAEVQSRNQPPEQGFKPGNPSIPIMITPVIKIREIRELKREQTRARARELLQLMEDMEINPRVTGMTQRLGSKGQINRYGMLRIMMGIVAEIGEIPQVDFQRLEKEAILSSQEIKNLRDIIPTVQLMLESIVR
ncbi:C protein [Tailam virus]|uniref:C protein n=1 Tax=Tailam virus TaxID=1117633 RepID=G9IRZ8_9MONO|nr:C protein [Tailam virus]AEU08859.1 C protein [Tailam virus]